MPGSSEVAWIEVFHSCFRVFHRQNCVQNRFLTSKDPPEPFLSHDVPVARLAKPPNDQFLKDFQQLESHLKQLTASSSASSIALQSECMGFFVRFLNTLDAFTWPDFLAVVSTRLAEQFVSCDRNSIRLSILHVFQQAKGQVNQLSDGTKLLTHLTNVLANNEDATTRALAWGIVETIPVLCADANQSHLHQLLLAVLDSPDSPLIERNAATKTAIAIAAVSLSFQELVIDKVFTVHAERLPDNQIDHQQKLLQYAALVAVCVRTPDQAQSIYLLYQQLYVDMVAVENATSCACLRTMTEIAIRFQNVPQHVLFLKKTIQTTQEPRASVVRCIYEQLQRMVNAKDSQVKLTVLQEVYSLLGHELDLALALSPAQERLAGALVSVGWMQLELLRCCSHQTTSGWTKRDDQAACKVVQQLHQCVAQAKQLVSKPQTPRFHRLYVQILMECAMNQVAAVSEAAKNTHGTTESISTAESCGFLVQLLVVLHPNSFAKEFSVWKQALVCMEEISQKHPSVVPRLSIGFLVKIIEVVADDSGSTTIKTSELLEQLLVFISHLVPYCVPLMHKNLSFLESLLERCEASRVRTRKALVVILLRLWRTLRFEHPELVREQALTQQLCDLPPSERYDLAKEALVHGFAQVAHRIICDFDPGFDNEIFVHWWHFVVLVSKAEARLVSQRGADLEIVNALEEAKIWLKASSTSGFRFDFQREWLCLRAEFVGVLLQLQQLLGEVVCTSQSEFLKHRVVRIVTRLQHLADHYNQLESALFGLQELDLELVRLHKRVCGMLIQALQGFILQQDWTPKLDNMSNQLSLAPMVPFLAMERLIQQELDQKLDNFKAIGARESKVALGGQLVQQLLSSLCAIPAQLPRVFFVEKLPPKVNANVQFLTFAERFSFPSKPRGRSQLGVPLGTAFTSFIKGVVEFKDVALQTLKRSVGALELCIELTRIESTTTTSNINNNEGSALWPSNQHRKPKGYSWSHQVAIQFNSDAHQIDSPRIPFETTLHVDAQHLHTKGSYSLTGQLFLVDAQEPTRRWSLQQPTAYFSRGLIVY